ncbi:hypothetical protein AOQ84DRAFT_341914 [Glonium stellatum]|uniref:Xylanolytic transcriptional activator regulatory domain-containing protein n=1 Tax=Glonium stellatum TaxID=574774 RepID=A0A8E2EZ18_9PEZI|nr:hypothetical protein AOQ84DRAFT_341914 [Glonium stellatum]
MLPSPQPTVVAHSPSRPKRPRAIQACNLCRAKKYRCDGVCPCSHCRSMMRQSKKRPRNEPPSYVKSLERRLEIAEAAVARAREGGSAGLGRPDVEGVPASIDPPAVKPPERFHSQPLAAAHETSPSQRVDRRSADSPDEDLAGDSATEVMDINPLTRDIEFHGNTSSVAFLGRVRQEYGDGIDERQQQHRSPPERPSLVSAFHNHTFLPQRDTIAEWNDGVEERFFSPQSYVFFDTYFNNLHYIHPILDQESFLHRCEELWQGNAQRQPRSFIALYFSVLSLGALIRTWTEQKINGMGRFEWSRMLFERAQFALGKPGLLNDLEAIQAMFIMAKVCQNELNPNLAYTYLGLAIRTSLSTGINRNTSIQGRHFSDNPDALILSKTWWGLYSLEIELSFALGRPDSLGMDEYHNRPLPPVEDSEISILASMIDMSHITRAISLEVYLSRRPLSEKLVRAFRIEGDMDKWVQKLPPRIRPSTDGSVEQDGNLSDPAWARLQRLVLQIRYQNLKMLLLRPFILHASKLDQPSSSYPGLEEAVTKCTNAAIQTIDIIYETFRVHTFFRTWWYNITYLTFAASILLFRAAQPPCTESQKSIYIPLVRKTLGILDIMDESVVARKTADVMRQMLNGLRERGSGANMHGNRNLNEGQSSAWPADGAAVRHSVFGHSEDPEVSGLGPSVLDGGFWDYGFELGDLWDIRGAGIDLYTTTM